MQVGGLAYVIENTSDAVRANVWVGTQCGTVYTLDLPVGELRSARQGGPPVLTWAFAALSEIGAAFTSSCAGFLQPNGLE